MKTNFVKTKDKKVADILRASGYTEITETGSEYYSFINDGKMNFEQNETKKLIFTNVMCL